jgi:hypothetical protein
MNWYLIKSYFGEQKKSIHRQKNKNNEVKNCSRTNGMTNVNCQSTWSWIAISVLEKSLKKLGNSFREIYGNIYVCHLDRHSKHFVHMRFSLYYLNQNKTDKIRNFFLDRKPEPNGKNIFLPNHNEKYNGSGPWKQEPVPKTDNGHHLANHHHSFSIYPAIQFNYNITHNTAC